MLVRDLKRLVLIVGPFVLVVVVCLKFAFNISLDAPDLLSQVGDWAEYTLVSGGIAAQHNDDHEGPPRRQPGLGDASNTGSVVSKPVFDTATVTNSPGDSDNTHHTIFSASRPDKKFFPISFGPGDANKVMNPNVIPHPTLPATWLVVAQQHTTGSPTLFAELACPAAFDLVSHALACTRPPAALPVPPTPGRRCAGDLAFFNLARGPHDARVFHGPHAPLAVYGSNSALTCFGLFAHDLARLLEATALPGGIPEPWWGDGSSDPPGAAAAFPSATELRRPAGATYREVEKNWFVFWDRGGGAYLHYDLFPARSFAALAADGTAGPELAAAAAAQDGRCLARYLPVPAPRLESLHQATNSLAVTMCRRAEAVCVAGPENTFVLTVVQHKKFYRWHSEYEPYVVLFRQEAPFELYGISQRPIWIHGRERRMDGSTDMFYVVSINWRDQGRKYHGYLDDVLFLAFGIEDERAGGMDVVAEDLLAGLGLCSDT